MSLIICPFCGNQSNNHNNYKSTIKEVIYKYLHVTLKEEYASNVCQKCEQIIIVWDEFAEKCLIVENIFEEKPDVKLSNVKVENSDYTEVKIENPSDISLCRDYEDNDDKYSLSPCDSKDEDPLSDHKSSTTSDREMRQVNRERNISVKNNRQRLRSVLKYICDICQIETKTWAGLKSHFLSEHSRSPSLLCFCGETLNSLRAVQYHKRKHRRSVKTEEKKNPAEHSRTENINEKTPPIIDFTCSACQFRVETWDNLELHCSKEHSMKARVLCICGRYIKSKASFYRHRQAHDEEKGFKCNQCNKNFMDATGLKEHIMGHVPKEKYNCKCLLCPKKFRTPLSLKLHMLTHERSRQHSCDICGIMLATKYGVKVHKIARHENVKDYICDVCGHAFSTKGGLSEHRSIHTQERKYKCDKCSKFFKTLNILKRHEDTHSDAILQCSQCPAVFKSRRNLISHSAVHIDVFKYSCKICNKNFKRSESLKKHINSHDGLKPYNCQWCNKIFSTNQNLRHHKQRAHPEKNDINNMCKDEIDTDIMSVHTEASSDFIQTFRNKTNFDYM